MPNLFSALPVEILAWVLASTSGLTRIDDRRASARGRRRPRAEQLELGLGLDVEAEDAGVEREGDLARGLADAGEDDALGRHAGGERAAQLALGDHVHAGAEPGERRAAPPGWSSPSWRSRPARRARRRPRRRRGSAASASPSNSSRTACRPRRRSPAAARPRHGARRRGRRNDARAGPVQSSGSRKNGWSGSRRCRVGLLLAAAARSLRRRRLELRPLRPQPSTRRSGRAERRRQRLTVHAAAGRQRGQALPASTGFRIRSSAAPTIATPRRAASVPIAAASACERAFSQRSACARTLAGAVPPIARAAR